jgi:multiple sugar transport system permease protein/putative aldouronate transport system permease protein
MAFKRSAASKASDIAIYTFLGIVSFLCLYPFWYLLIYTLSDPVQAVYGVRLWPRGFSLYNIQKVLKLQGIGRSMGNSILRTVSGTILTVVSCSFLGYVFTKEEMPARKAIYRGLIITMYISGGLIPTYLIMRAYGLTNNFFVYILPAAVSAYNVILIKTFIEQLPASLEEAAMIDGAGYFTTYTRVIFPLCVPIIATIAIFASVGQWNSWFDNHIYNTNSKELMTLQYQLYKFLNESQRLADMLRQGNLSDVESALTKQLTPKGVRVTTTLFAALPIFLVYPFMQRYFIKGIMIGAVKG